MQTRTNSTRMVLVAVALFGCTMVRFARAEGGGRNGHAAEDRCRDQWQCEVMGWCTEVNGECRAASNNDCAASEYCLERGGCWAEGGKCVREAEHDDFDEPYVENATRLRFGLSPMLAAGTAYDRVLVAAGGELRAGVQINDYFAIVAQPHIVAWSVNLEGGGAAGANLLADLTLGDQFYLSAGGGYNYVFGGDGKWEAVAHDASGPGFLGRIGGYPVVDRLYIHRVGLQTGVEIHAYFGETGPAAAVFGTLGVELF